MGYTDYYTKHGAGLLADAITGWWAKRGYPWVLAERYALPAELGWAVRSNLVNGLPPRRAA